MAAEVTGMAELRAVLAELAPELVGRLDRLNADLAQEIISRARGGARGKQAAHAAATLGPVVSPGGGGVSFGGLPYAMGAEFGAGRDRARQRRTGTYRGYNQFPPYRGSGPTAGHFLWPAYREVNVQERYAELLDLVLAEVWGD